MHAPGSVLGTPLALIHSSSQQLLSITTVIILILYMRKLEKGMGHRNVNLPSVTWLVNDDKDPNPGSLADACCLFNEITKNLMVNFSL